uniref:Protein kinase domain-containing protein n=1 Tax=Panagrolaimus sp. JU765 TaxID=591449 RepID=A0AC34QY25_9BILA
MKMTKKAPGLGTSGKDQKTNVEQKQPLNQRIRNKLFGLRKKKDKDHTDKGNPTNESVTDSTRQKNTAGKQDKESLKQKAAEKKKKKDPSAARFEKEKSVEKERTKEEATVEDAIPAGTAPWKLKKIEELTRNDMIFGRRMSVRIGDVICTEEHGKVFKALSSKQQEGGFIAPRKEENIPVALKTDVATGSMKKWFNTEKEVLLAISLARPASICDHFPQIFDSGELYFLRYVMMTLHGPNIEKLRRDILKADFTMNTATRVAYQILQSIVDLHFIGFIHRDLKPTNFVVGLDAGGDCFLRSTNLRTIYMVGFGTCAKKKEQQEKTEQRRFVNLTFGSRRSHTLTHVLDKNDDFESWLYLAVELFRRNSLPWRKKTNKTEILTMKQKFFDEVGFSGIYEFLPEQFKMIIKKAFTDGFDVASARDLIRDIARKNMITEKSLYDWEVYANATKDLKLEGDAKKPEEKPKAKENEEKQESTELDDQVSVMLKKLPVFEKNITFSGEEIHSCTSLDPTYSQNALKSFVENEPGMRTVVPKAIPPDDPLIKLTLTKTKKKMAKNAALMTADENLPENWARPY